MARTNLHELANRLLRGLEEASDGRNFEGKLREVAAGVGLNSVRSAEAIKLLEELKRIEVVQRGRRGRDTIISILSTQPVSLSDAEAMLPSRAARRSNRITYDEIGRAAVDRLLELSRDDSLRAAQVDAFATERDAFKAKVKELENAIEEASRRETDLRIKLKTAEEALERAEENLRRVFGPQRAAGEPAAPGSPVDDEDARALLEILRSGRA